jgi:hypothetical protein
MIIEMTCIGRIESGFDFLCYTISLHVCASFMSTSRGRVFPPGLVRTCDDGSCGSLGLPVRRGDCTFLSPLHHLPALPPCGSYRVFRVK